MLSKGEISRKKQCAQITNTLRGEVICDELVLKSTVEDTKFQSTRSYFANNWLNRELKIPKQKLKRDNKWWVRFCNELITELENK